MTDWDYAKLKLQGQSSYEIAAKLGTYYNNVYHMFDKIGFPAPPCIFYRGEAVSGKHLRDVYDDLKFLRMRPALLRLPQTNAMN